MIFKTGGWPSRSNFVTLCDIWNVLAGRLHERPLPLRNVRNCMASFVLHFRLTRFALTVVRNS
jgi:hypothetical protein